MDSMQRATELARKAVGNVSPNPAVGAVIIREGRVVGEGYTQPPGGPHAEIEALRQAGDLAQGAAIYVTLEPCLHHGRTPPCTEALLRAGIAEVHIAILDPNPQVNGGGAADLKAAGIQVTVGERESDAREVMRDYLKWKTTGLPFVTAKYAMSLDGKTATESGESRWITGEASRRRVHQLRGACDAIMVGAGTALQDDPQLTARDETGRPLERQPLRVVVDSDARLPSDAAVLQGPGRILVATAHPPRERAQALVKAGAEVLNLPAQDGRVDLRELLYTLGGRQVTSVLAEGGGTLLATLLHERLVDKVLAFIAPVIIGGRDAPTPVNGSGVQKLAAALRLEDVTVERLEDDLLVTGCPGKGP